MSISFSLFHSSQALSVQDNLLARQPDMKRDLLEGITSFRQAVDVFVHDYGLNGPMTPGRRALTREAKSDKKITHFYHNTNLFRSDLP